MFLICIYKYIYKYIYIYIYICEGYDSALNVKYRKLTYLQEYILKLFKK